MQDVLRLLIHDNERQKIDGVCLITNHFTSIFLQTFFLWKNFAQDWGLQLNYPVFSLIEIDKFTYCYVKTNQINSRSLRQDSDN